MTIQERQHQRRTAKEKAQRKELPSKPKAKTRLMRNHLAYLLSTCKAEL
jgi:hypothetical protein